MTDFAPSYGPVDFGPLARRPAAPDVGRMLWVDETGAIWVSDGASWLQSVPPIGTYASLVKTDAKGGQYPKPLRVPTLAVVDQSPRLGSSATWRPMWVSGSTVYALGRSDKSLYKSTDGGATYALLHSQGTGFGNQGVFLKTSANSLLTADGGAPQKLYRSTDDGTTFTAVYTQRTSCTFLGPQSICQDANTGYLYAVEYQTVDTFAAIQILRSTDDGATWAVWKSLNGPTSGTADKIRHVHSCQYDSVSQRVYFCIGDNEAKAGIFRVNAGGTDIETVVTNDQTVSGRGARAVGLMFFANYIGWCSDDPTTAGVYRLARTAIGAASNMTPSYMVNGAGLFTCKASSDGSRWIFSADNETGSLDNAVHVYAVEDDGATVYECGVIGTPNSGVVGLAPIGQAENHTDTLWLRGHNFSVEQFFKLKMALGSGGDLGITAALPRVVDRNSIRPGPIVVAAGTTVVVGHMRAPAQTGASLVVFDIGVFTISGTGTLRAKITSDAAGTAVLGSMSTTSPSFRMANNRASDEYMTIITGLTANQDVYFVISETGGVNPATGAFQASVGFAP